MGLNGIKWGMSIAVLNCLEGRFYIVCMLSSFEGKRHGKCSMNVDHFWKRFLQGLSTFMLVEGHFSFCTDSWGALKFSPRELAGETGPLSVGGVMENASFIGPLTIRNGSIIGLV